MDPTSRSLITLNNTTRIGYHKGDLSEFDKWNYNEEIEELCFEIQCLDHKDENYQFTDKELNNLFKQSLCYLKIDNENEELKTTLSCFLPKVFKIENIHSDTLKKAKKIESLLNIKSEEKCVPSLSSSFSSAPQNMFYQIRNRQLNGLQLESQKDYNEKLVIKNIKEGNYKKSIYEEHSDQLINLHLQGDLIVTRSKNEMKLLNLKEDKYLWTNGCDNSNIWPLEENKLEILKGHLCFLSKNRFRQPNLCIIDYETGKDILDINDNENTCISSFCVLDNRIFNVRTNILDEYGNFDKNFERKMTLEELDIKGQIINSFNLFECQGSESWEREESYTKLLASKRFLVFLGTSKETIIILDLQKQSQKIISLYFPCGDPSKSCALISDDHLFFGFIDGFYPYCFVIDLKSGKLINQYQINECVGGMGFHYSRSEEIQFYSPNKLVANKEWAFCGFSISENKHIIVAMNLTNNEYIILGDHLNPITDLALNGKILISISNSYREKEAEIKFWDIKSMKLIQVMKFYNTALGENISFDDEGNLYVGVGKSLVKYEFSVLHQGKKLAEKSVPETIKEELFPVNNHSFNEENL